ncbi:MAG: SDR family NAD(P)-dependent oxidoreductase [Chloroflexi bacterium]|nr:SDR family NAD(P)-dependent oxidoreductase [Chloroflexota bacterium]
MKPTVIVQLAIPHLRSRRGRVINVSGGGAVTAMAGWSANCVSKAGISHLTAVLAEEESEITALGASDR